MYDVQTRRTVRYVYAMVGMGSVSAPSESSFLTPEVHCYYSNNDVRGKEREGCDPEPASLKQRCSHFTLTKEESGGGAPPRCCARIARSNVV